MARNHDTSGRNNSVEARGVGRRALLSMGLPALGAAGIAAAAPRQARASEAGTSVPAGDTESDGSELTAHREAYYRRARF